MSEFILGIAGVSLVLLVLWWLRWLVLLAAVFGTAVFIFVQFIKWCWYV